MLRLLFFRSLRGFFEPCLGRRGRASNSISARISSTRAMLLAACVTLPLGTACGGSPVGRGCALYEQQDYIEAAEAFERTQSRLVSMQPRERARYGLYRGLTFMALGDWRGAERWLDYADALQRTEPTLLPTGERELLARGRRELSQRIRESWPEPDASASQRVAASTVAGHDNGTLTR